MRHAAKINNIHNDDQADWEELCRAPLRVVEHIQGPELNTHRSLSSWAHSVFKTIRPCSTLYGLWPTGAHPQGLLDASAHYSSLKIRQSTVDRKKWEEGGCHLSWSGLQLWPAPCGGLGVIWRTFFSREVVHNVQRSCGEAGGYGMCFDSSVGGVNHIGGKAEYGSHFTHVTSLRWHHWRHLRSWSESATEADNIVKGANQSFIAPEM